jgi:hypothetical protein
MGCWQPRGDVCRVSVQNLPTPNGYMFIGTSPDTFFIVICHCSFLFYYPKQMIGTTGYPYTCGFGLDRYVPQCGSTYVNNTIQDTRMLDRSFGGSNVMCKATTGTTNSSTTKSGVSTGRPTMYYGLLLSFIFLIMWN